MIRLEESRKKLEDLKRSAPALMTFTGAGKSLDDTLETIISDVEKEINKLNEKIEHIK